MKVIRRYSPNYSKTNIKKVGIQIHKTLGLMPGALSWLLNPASKSSAHYLIPKSGNSYQLVRLRDRAWTAGRIKLPSLRGLSIMKKYPIGTKPGEYLIQFEVECLKNEAYNEHQINEIGRILEEEVHKELGYEIKLEGWNTLTHQDTAVYKPNLERERAEILKRFGSTDDTNKRKIKELMLKIALLRLQILRRKLSRLKK